MVATISAVMMLLVTNLPRLPLALVAAATGLLMLTNAGRMVAAMAMVTGSVEPTRRGGFMSANSAVQHFSTGLGAYLGGLIIAGDPVDHSIRNFDKVGFIAVGGDPGEPLARRARPACRQESAKPADDLGLRECARRPALGRGVALTGRTTVAPDSRSWTSVPMWKNCCSVSTFAPMRSSFNTGRPKELHPQSGWRDLSRSGRSPRP